MSKRNNNNKFLLSEIIQNNITSKIDITKIIDDIPVISLNEYSINIWKYIFESNYSNKELLRSKTILNITDPKLISWLCSLDLSKGTDMFLFILGKDFIKNNKDIFIIVRNFSISLTSENLTDDDLLTKITFDKLKTDNDVISYIEHIINKGILSHHRPYIFDFCYTILQNPPKYITKEEIYLIHYVVSYSDIEVIFDFSIEGYFIFIDLIFSKFHKSFNKISLRNLINSEYYKEIYNYLTNSKEYEFSNEFLIEHGFIDSRIYDNDCFTFLLENGFSKDKLYKSFLVNGINIGFLFNRNLWNYDILLPLINNQFIIKYYEENGIPRDGIPIIWRNVKVNIGFLESICSLLAEEFANNKKRRIKKYKIQINSENILECIGSIITKMNELWSNDLEIEIFFDYENTENNIIFDLAIHNLLTIEIKNEIVMNNNYLLKKCI